MMKVIVNVKKKSEVLYVITGLSGGYNHFRGEIRNGSRYALIAYCYYGNRLSIEITYCEDGQECAVEKASHCATASGAANKIAKFLGVD